MEVDGPSKHADSKQVFLQLKHRILKMRRWSRWNLTTGIMFILASSSTWLFDLTYFLENKRVPWKSMVGRCISYSNSPFLGDRLVFGGVFCLFFLLPVSYHAGSIWWIAGFQAKAEGGRPMKFFGPVHVNTVEMSISWWRSSQFPV